MVRIGWIVLKWEGEGRVEELLLRCCGGIWFVM